MLAETFTALLTGVAKKGGELAASEIAKRISGTMPGGNSANQSDKKISAEIFESLRQFTLSSYEKCSNIKTLVNRDKPIGLLDHYVNVRFRLDRKIHDQYSLIDSISTQKFILICGNGGTGKSIFMKYLWIASYVRYADKIPVFIELRNYNEITKDDFLLFLRSTIFSTMRDPSLVDSLFHSMLVSGNFTFIFDGFDEVLESKKESVERQIIQLAEKFGGNQFIVSSRPLDHLRGWRKFFVYDVMPFTRADIIELIRKLEFDTKIKGRFLDRIKSGLFESHRSFLENPLLATMMLITFNDFAEIPSRMHVFYEQAFMALVLRHDANKEAFNRPLNTQLATDQFKLLFSYFCLISYKEEKYRFSEDDIIRIIDITKKSSNIEVSNSDFKKDMIERVCLLYRDGTEYVFIHRSFQEYFTAFCMLSLEDKFLVQAADLFMRRTSDNVFLLLYGMNEMKFDAVIAAHFTDSVYKSRNLPLGERVSALMEGGRVEVYQPYMRKGRKNIEIVFDARNIKYILFCRIYLSVRPELSRIFGKKMFGFAVFRTKLEEIPTRFRKLISENKLALKFVMPTVRQPVPFGMVLSIAANGAVYDHEGPVVDAEFLQEIKQWFVATPGYRDLTRAIETGDRLSRELLERKRKYSDMMEVMFSEPPVT